jgi:hypothetical protein
MSMNSRTAKPKTQDTTKLAAQILGADATEVGVTPGIAHPGWVYTRTIGSRRTFETLVAMKSPPTDTVDTNADDSILPDFGAAYSLQAFTVPASVVHAVSFTVVVHILDAHGNLNTSSTASVVLSSSLATLSGTLTQAAVAGVATFTGLAQSVAGSAVLTMTSAGLVSATAPLTVT